MNFVAKSVIKCYYQARRSRERIAEAVDEKRFEDGGSAVKVKLNGRRVGAALFFVAVAAILLIVFSLLNTPGSNQDIFLMDRDSERFGWRYEVLVNGEARPIEPTFTNEYTLALPEGTEAVRMTRTMTEDFQHTELEWTSYCFGVEVFWNGRLLHSDFQGTQRDANGFLQSAWEELEGIQAGIDRGESSRTVRMTLPGDGPDGARELSMITYFPKGWKDPLPEYPFVGSDDSEAALIVSESVLPVTTALFNAVLALLLAAVFLMEARSGKLDGGTPLLSLHFVTMYIELAYDSSPGYYSALKEFVNLSVLSRVCTVPLYLFLASRLTRKWRYPLCACVIGWTLYECARMLINLRRGELAFAGRNGLGAFVLVLLVGTAVILEEIFVQRRIRSRKALLTVLLIVAGSAIVSVLNSCKGWNGMGEYLVSGVLGSLRSGYFWPAVHLISDFASVMASVGVLLGFMREVLRRRGGR